MENVYDIIADFYDHDENWNMLLRREYAEGYIRKEAWKGLNDRQLQKKWEQVMMLCLYLGYAETFLGDMTDNDFIDAMAGLVCAVFIVLTCNIVTGIMLGFVTLVVGRVFAREWQKLNIGTVIITAALVAFYAGGWAI